MSDCSCSAPDPQEPADREQVVATARCLTENLVSVIEVRPGLKKPLHGGDSFGHYDDPDVVDEALRSRPELPNIGLLLHPKADSHIVVVDMDGPAGLARAKELGVSREEGSWQWRSGRGGICAAYWWSGAAPLPRVTRAGGVTLDLLSNGFAIIPPSSTYLYVGEDGRRGGPYRWIEGHSPFDITPPELEPPPDALAEWWQGLGRKAPADTSELEGRAGAWALLTEVIAEGGRNDALTRIAGWLRLYHPPPVAEALLLVVNDARCFPPLPPEEVKAIVRSVCKYSQPGVVGHPKALVPSEWERVDV